MRPPAVREEIARAVDRGVPVVVTSRCPAGDLLRGTYDYLGSETDLRALGVLFGSGLNGPKARIRLALALGAGADRTRLAELFPG